MIYKRIYANYIYIYSIYMLYIYMYMYRKDRYKLHAKQLRISRSIDPHSADFNVRLGGQPPAGGIRPGLSRQASRGNMDQPDKVGPSARDQLKKHLLKPRLWWHQLILMVCSSGPVPFVKLKQAPKVMSRTNAHLVMVDLGFSCLTTFMPRISTVRGFVMTFFFQTWFFSASFFLVPCNWHNFSGASFASITQTFRPSAVAWRGTADPWWWWSRHHPPDQRGDWDGRCVWGRWFWELEGLGS